jgi:hypothetical protein
MAQILPRLPRRLLRVQAQESKSLCASCFGQRNRALISRSYSTAGAQQPTQTPKQRSRHASWYSELLPGMVPIALVGFVVYGVSLPLLYLFCQSQHRVFGQVLEITRITLSREKQSVDHVARIEQLEREITAERAKRALSQTAPPTQVQTEGSKGQRWSLW